MNPRKRPTPRHVPRLDWPNLTDEALEQLRTLVEAERQRRWCTQRPRALVDDLLDSGRTPLTRRRSTPTIVEPRGRDISAVGSCAKTRGRRPSCMCVRSATK